MSPKEPTPQEKDGSSLLPLGTAFVPPQLPVALIERERLLAELQAASRHRLVLLSASAGSGKTTLLAAWAVQIRASAQSLAWLSLSEIENDPTRFWTSIILALRTCFPSLGEAALHLLRSPQPAPLSTILTALINEMLEQAEDIFLVLDDYQLIEDQAIHETMTFLLDHLPANLHLVLASRVDPDLPLARWRTRGYLLEIRDGDLSFTPQETACFLSEVPDQRLQEEEVALLHQRTEGWVAGLQLATLALRKHTDHAIFLQRFTGSHRYLMDYVQQEILQRHPLPLQQFLLRISVLSRMNADLCQAVTGEPMSQEFLGVLERANLFLIPLDDRRHWYRLHDLFREVLLARLQTTDPALVVLLHQHAARWYEQHGEFQQAIAHVLEASDFSFAAQLMERAAESLWLRGEATTVHRWVMALPQTIFREHAHFALTAALYLLYSTLYVPQTQRTSVLTRVEQTIERVEQVLQGREDPPLAEEDVHVLSQRLRLLRSWYPTREAYLQGDTQHLRLLAQHMQELAQGDEIIWQLIPLFHLVTSHDFQGESVTLIPLLEDVKQMAKRAQDHEAQLRVMQWLENAYQAAGQLHRAYQEGLEAVALQKQNGGQIYVTGYLSLDLADMYRMWNRLEEAQGCLQTLLQDANAWQHLELLTWGYCGIAQVKLATGDLSDGLQAIEEAEALAHQSGLAFALPSIAAWRVQLWLAQGQLTKTAQWATQSASNLQILHYWRGVEYQTLIRVYLAHQQYQEAWQLSERLLTQAENDQRGRDVIHLLALQVVTLHGLGKTLQTRAMAVRLLTEAAPEGYIRVYLDLGEPMHQVLQHLRDAPPDEERSLAAVPQVHLSTVLAAFQQEKPRQTTPAATPPATSLLLEPLSHQEIRVLRLLVAGRSNPEIANTLIVSVNTVKTQVQSIYRKLGVTNRVEASAAARNLHLL